MRQSVGKTIHLVMQFYYSIFIKIFQPFSPNFYSSDSDFSFRLPSE